MLYVKHGGVVLHILNWLHAPPVVQRPHMVLGIGRK